ncbi:hypothetical protein [Lysobacter soyae]|uniref:Uncharacterized protein n=1 Tax=Lysobacter soyae TaxID=2764185 RepID=A0ABX8WNA4_9GAMM|nr:hypothetical protein [Lysobacter sp. CJ11]QYR53101.1 hypothetical protein H8L67_00835 [Lysobacter sp. CJ11]
MKHHKSSGTHLTIGLAMLIFMLASWKASAAETTVLRVERVSDADLALIQGKYYGANLLVGVRVDMVSNWRAPDGGWMQGVAAVQMQRDANGAMQVSIHTTAGATGSTDGSTPLVAITRSATGAESVSGNGLTQVTQLAGDRNSVANLAQISFVPTLGDSSQFNGNSYASAAQGGYSTEVRFAANGMSMALQGPNGTAMQSVGDGNGVMQAARVAGDNQSANNALNLQVQTSGVTEDLQRQWGVQNALSGLRGLPR